MPSYKFGRKKKRMFLELGLCYLVYMEQNSVSKPPPLKDIPRSRADSVFSQVWECANRLKRGIFYHLPKFSGSGNLKNESLPISTSSKRSTSGEWNTSTRQADSWLSLNSPRYTFQKYYQIFATTNLKTRTTMLKRHSMSEKSVWNCHVYKHCKNCCL